MRLPYFHIIILIIINGFYLIACGIVNNEPETEQEEQIETDYFYYGNNRQILLFKSPVLISAHFNAGVPDERKAEILNGFGLEYEDEAFIKDKMLLLRLPEGADVGQFLTTYPKEADPNSFGNHPDVRFSVPAFFMSPNFHPDSYYFIFDEIAFRSDHDQEFIESQMDYYGLEIKSINQFGRYILKLTPDAKFTTLEMANYLYEQDYSIWSHPNAFVKIITEPGH